MSNFHFAIFFIFDSKSIANATAIQLPQKGSTLRIKQGPNKGTYIISDEQEWETQGKGSECQIVNINVSLYH